MKYIKNFKELFESYKINDDLIRSFLIKYTKCKDVLFEKEYIIILDSNNAAMRFKLYEKINLINHFLIDESTITTDPSFNSKIKQVVNNVFYADLLRFTIKSYIKNEITPDKLFNILNYSDLLKESKKLLDNKILNKIKKEISKDSDFRTKYFEEIKELFGDEFVEDEGIIDNRL
jgi:hypothetical protein